MPIKAYQIYINSNPSLFLSNLCLSIIISICLYQSKKEAFCCYKYINFRLINCFLYINVVCFSLRLHKSGQVLVHWRVHNLNIFRIEAEAFLPKLLSSSPNATPNTSDTSQPNQLTLTVCKARFRCLLSFALSLFLSLSQSFSPFACESFWHLFTWYMRVCRDVLLLQSLRCSRSFQAELFCCFFFLVFGAQRKVHFDLRQQRL